MPHDGIRRLSLGDLDDTTLRRLVGHSEDLFVERKRDIPKAGLGRVVASFANSLGGWVLLGVADNGSLVGYQLPGRADPQSHIGQLLAAEVEPLPPFVAAVRELDGTALLIVRVFESSDTPHLLRTGSIPIRTPKGTENVTDQSLLLDLARRGEEALARARERTSIDSIVLALATPERPELVAVSDAEPYAVVRASLVTSMPQFAAWATSKAAAKSVVAAADIVASALSVNIDAGGTNVTVRGRGVTAGWRGGFDVPVAARVAVEAEGVVGARVSRGRGAGEAVLESFGPKYISPLIKAVSGLLGAAEAFGRAAWRLDIGIPRQDFRIVDAERQLSRPFFAFAELASPPSPSEMSELSDMWFCEFARELGVEAWS
jgi:hypothetical protein